MAKEILKAMRLSEQPTIVVSFFYGILDLSPFYRSRIIDYVSVGAGLVMISVGSFVLNDYSDKKSDTNRTDRQPSEISGGATLLAVLCLVVPGIILGSYGGAPLCAIGACIFGLLYSLPKIQLKRIAVLDLASLGLCFVILPYMAPSEILVGRYQILHIPPVSLLNLAFLVSFLSSCNLIAMIRDIDADFQAGVWNTTVRVGLENSLRLGLSFTVVAYIIGTILVYQQAHWWYYPAYLCTPIVATIYGFGLGACPDRAKISFFFASKARAGIATGNVLAALLFLFILTVVVIFKYGHLW